jgi:hypothetical protein
LSSQAAARASAERGARLRVEVQAQLVGVLGSSARCGQTWKPRQASLTAQATCATSAATRAREGVPLTVCTVVVCSQSGVEAGTRFWKNDGPPAPCGNRCMSTGRPPIARMSGASTAA